MGVSLLVQFVVERAKKEAQGMKYPDILPEHLLLGLLKACQMQPDDITDQEKEKEAVDREIKALMAKVVESMPKGWEISDLRVYIRKILRTYRDQGQPQLVRKITWWAQHIADQEKKDQIEAEDIFEAMSRVPTDLLKVHYPDLYAKKWAKSEGR